jgi:hypothetical protein
VATVAIGFTISLAHAVTTRGRRVGVALVVVTTAGGLGIEALGVATGFPFGTYHYGDALGPKLWGVPLIVPLAWTWMAWPAWLAAGELAGHLALRVPLAGLALAAWDLFLDPQMVAEGYWGWGPPDAALGAFGAVPAVDQIPASNYLAWLMVAVSMMALLALSAGTGRRRGRRLVVPVAHRQLRLLHCSPTRSPWCIGRLGAIGAGLAGADAVRLNGRDARRLGRRRLSIATAVESAAHGDQRRLRRPAVTTASGRPGLRPVAAAR